MLPLHGRCILHMRGLYVNYYVQLASQQKSVKGGPRYLTALCALLFSGEAVLFRFSYEFRPPTLAQGGFGKGYV
jgi:hypothetical protein